MKCRRRFRFRECEPLDQDSTVHYWLAVLNAHKAMTMAVSSKVVVFLVMVAMVARAAVFPSYVSELLDAELVKHAQQEYVLGSMKIFNSLALPGVTGHISKQISSSNTCSATLKSQSIRTDSCLTDGSMSIKFQIITDSCAGASIQYFHDDSCTLFAGIKEISADKFGCHQADANTYTSLSCSADVEVEETFLLAGGDPSAEPTAEPSAEPSAEPTEAPTDAPVGEPTPAPSAAPTAAPTASPTAAPTATPTTAYPTSANVATVAFAAKQTITGVSCADYLANAMLNEQTIKQAIAASMIGVTPDNIEEFLAQCISSSSASLHPHSAMSKVASYLRSAGFHALADTLSISYVVRLMTNIPVEDLIEQLTTATTDGTFDANLHEIATENSATDLLGAETEPVEAVVIPPNNHTNELSSGGVAAVIIGTIFGVVLLVLAAYFLFVSGGKASYEGAPHMVSHAGGDGEEYTVAL